MNSNTINGRILISLMKVRDSRMALLFGPVQLFRDLMDCSILGLLALHHLLESAQIHVHWVSDAVYNHLILCIPLLLLCSIFPSIRVFSNELALHIRWPKYWRFSLSISPSSEYSVLISFMIAWFDLLAVQRTLKSLLQHHSSKASSAFGVLYGPTLRSVQNYWKNHSFTVRTFASKVMSVLFNMLSRFAMAFLPKSKRLLISWLQSSYEFGQMDNDIYPPRWYHTE